MNTDDEIALQGLNFDLHRHGLTVCINCLRGHHDHCASFTWCNCVGHECIHARALEVGS